MMNKFLILVFLVGGSWLFLPLESNQSNVPIARSDLEGFPKLTDHYVEVPHGKIFCQKAGEGTPIILLHGGPGMNHNYFFPQMLELAKDHQLLAYDQRGSGNSSLISEVGEMSICMEQFVEDLEAVRRHFEYRKFILVGHSWGGLLAVNYALKYPNNLVGLVLIHSCPMNLRGYKEFVESYKKRMAPNKHLLEEITQSSGFSQGDSELVRSYYKTMIQGYFYRKNDCDKLFLPLQAPLINCSEIKVNSIFEKTFFDNEFNCIPQLHHLTVPTLILHGEEDIIPVKTAYETSRAIPNSKLIVIDKCDHFSFIEQPEQFFGELRNFIRDGK